MNLKPQRTVADYLAMTVCPALIMVLVGSLVFFLLQIGYSGEWIGRLRWTLFWFVLAMVLVSRIAIEQNPGSALLYGLALAGATHLLLLQYVGFVWQVWLLLGLVWWVSNKITWDCTLIDEDADASGKGLLDASLLRDWTQRQLAQVRAVPGESESTGLSLGSPSAYPSAPPIPIPGLRLPASRPKPKSKSEVRKKTWFQKQAEKQKLHSPGKWILYFSAAAVPIFGLGELAVPGSDAQGRMYCFSFMLAYLASGLGLLLLTSFLGLRRYLRQRNLQMPGPMAASWITHGVFITCVILAIALFLPRPLTPYSTGNLVSKLAGLAQKASKKSLLNESGAEGESNQEFASRTGKPSPNEVNQGEQEQDQTNDPRAREQQGGKKLAKGQLSPPASPRLPSSPNSKWLWLIITFGIALFAWRYRKQLRDMVQALIAALRNLFGSGLRPLLWKRKSSPMPEEKRLRSLPRNPFSTGQAERMALTELVKLTYDSLTIWAERRGFALKQSETPLELAERLGNAEPAVEREVLLLSGYYSHVAYSAQSPSDECLPVLKQLWTLMTTGGTTAPSGKQTR